MCDGPACRQMSTHAEGEQHDGIQRKKKCGYQDEVDGPRQVDGCVEDDQPRVDGSQPGKAGNEVRQPSLTGK